MKAPLFSEDETATIIRQMLKALLAVHNMNLIHRDIKPENVILQQSNDKLIINQNQSDLKLIDFGFCVTSKMRIWEKLEDNVGTTLFMAPEQIQRESYGKVSQSKLFFFRKQTSMPVE